jgi:outer membrane biogenesis lipoprotein LolB
MTVRNSAFSRGSLALLAALLLAACADANQPPKAAATNGEPVPTSAEQAKTQCWMRYENNSAPRDLDKRLALVDKCIDEKMKLMHAQ